MKVLVSTKQTQGQRKSDFCWCMDGEFVFFGFECCGNDDVDTGCGCQRDLIGIFSRRGTTTAEVIDLTISEEVFTALILFSSRKAFPSLDCNQEALNQITREVEEFLDTVGRFPEGSIIENRGNRLLQVREQSYRPRLSLARAAGNFTWPKATWFSVLLLNPDYVDEGSPTYLAWVEAESVEEAIKKAKQMAADAWEVDEPEDFATLLCCEGCLKPRYYDNREYEG